MTITAQQITQATNYIRCLEHLNIVSDAQISGISNFVDLLIAELEPKNHQEIRRAFRQVRSAHTDLVEATAALHALGNEVAKETGIIIPSGGEAVLESGGGTGKGP